MVLKIKFPFPLRWRLISFTHIFREDFNALHLRCFCFYNIKNEDISTTSSSSILSQYVDQRNIIGKIFRVIFL